MFPLRNAFVAVAFTALIPSSTVFAQSEPGRIAPIPDTPSPARSYPLRVESAMTINIPVSAGAGTEEQVKQIAAARASLYQASAQDCENLKQAFKAECRLVNVRVNSNVQSRGSSGEMMFVNVQSTYEVTVRPN